MYSFEQQIRVMLRFRGMPEPVEVSVPFNVLRYLDRHAERQVGIDGEVVYEVPDGALESDRPVEMRLPELVAV